MGSLHDLNALREWIPHALGSAVELLAAERLPGATSSTLYRIRVQVGGQPMCLVLRLFTNQEWLREEPDLVRHEAASLRQAAQLAAHAAQAPVLTPQPIAVDEGGSVCGAPAVPARKRPDLLQGQGAFTIAAIIIRPVRQVSVLPQRRATASNCASACCVYASVSRSRVSQR